LSLIAAPRNEFLVDEWAYQALRKELLIILRLLLLLFDWVPVLV
jgi:hypothetical protein